MKSRIVCSSTRSVSPGCARRPFSRLQIHKCHWRRGAEKDQLITGVEAGDCPMKLGEFFYESEDEECLPSVPRVRGGRLWNYMSPFVVPVARDTIKSIHSWCYASSRSPVDVHSRLLGLGPRGWRLLGEELNFQLFPHLDLDIVH